MTIQNKGSKILAKQIVVNPVENTNATDYEGTRHSVTRVRICFKREQIIGSGSFGVVQTVNIYKIFDDNGSIRLPDQGLRFAMKTIKVKRKESRELEILKHINHQNIVSLRYYFYNTCKETGEMKLNLLFDLHDISLHDLIHQLIEENSSLEESQIASFAYQILKGLQYLHQSQIAHRDLKPRNILLDVSTDKLQICDLGSACRLNQENLGELNPYICSRFYRAPELLLGSTRYTTKVDIWSFGCLVGEMCLLEPLVPGCDTGDQIGEDVESMGLAETSIYCTIGDLYERMSCDITIEERLTKMITNCRNSSPQFTEPAVELISSALQYNPTTRHSAHQLVEHQFFQLFDLFGEKI